MAEIISNALVGFGILSVLHALPSFFYSHSFIHQALTKCQESYRADFPSRLRVGSGFSLPRPLQSLDKENIARIHLILYCPPNPHVHSSLHSLTSKISICFAEILYLGTVLRRSIMKKMKNAYQSAHSSWNPRGHQQCFFSSPFLDVESLY